MRLTKFKAVLFLTLDNIAEFYPYFLGLYICALITRALVPAWQTYFNWPAFHISIIGLGGLTLLSPGFQQGRVWGAAKFKIRQAGIVDFVLAALAILLVAILILLSISSLLTGVVIVFGYFSMFWLKDSRIAAGLGIGCLFCTVGVGYISGLNSAQLPAIYTFYFLIIAILTSFLE